MTLRDITGSPRLLRRAIALCGVRLASGTGLSGVEKAMWVARAAGVQAAKQAAQLIPSCHIAPLESITIDFITGNSRIDIRAEVKAIHRTTLDAEALTGALIAAISLFADLSSAGLDVEAIEEARLERAAGKEKSAPGRILRAGILVLSDSVAAGSKGDASGGVIAERLQALNVSIAEREILPDDEEIIESVLAHWCDELRLDLIVTSGGTGVGPRDITPEVMERLVERRLPGIEEAMRAHGQERTPHAMLSRGVAGQRGATLLLALPGSPKGVAESLDALLPALLHAIPVIEGAGHEGSGYARPASV
jgi:molybdenum cofactor synthesis domain-containing protein